MKPSAPVIILIAIAAAALFVATRGADGTAEPEPPFRTDRDRSDPFALRVEDLMQDGTPAAIAEEIALREFDDGMGTACLTHTVALLYCVDGKLNRVLKRLHSSCLEALGGTSGCTPLVCPPGWTGPTPWPTVMPCPAPLVPMVDTMVDWNCAGLPSSVGCVWMFPTSTTPSWTPCDGILGCSCFPLLVTDCAALTIECRNPSNPRNSEGECPDCGN